MKKIQSRELRDKQKSVFDDVQWRDEVYIVSRLGKDSIVILSIEMYEEIIQRITAMEESGC